MLKQLESDTTPDKAGQLFQHNRHNQILDFLRYLLMEVKNLLNQNPEKDCSWLGKILYQ